MSQILPADAAESRPQLVRVVGPLMAMTVVIGTVMGSGIFRKPASIAQQLPDFNYVALVWILGGLLSFFGALALAEVCVLFPQAGGNYVFLREGFGRLAGFLWGWVEFWMIRAGSLAALATVFTDSLHDILIQTLHNSAPGSAEVLSFWQQRLVTVAVIAALALVNVRGARWGGGLQFFITLIKVASLLGIMLLPIVFWGPELQSTSEKLRQRNPEVAFTWGGLGTAMLGVMWAYHGWMNIAPLAGEVTHPQRNLPIAFLGGVGCIVFLYLGTNLAYHLVIPLQEMAGLPGDTTVATHFCLRLLGSAGAVVASAAVMCSVFGALNGNLLVGPRLLYAMGEDGLAPRALSAVHPRFHTPALAILVMSGWAILLVLAAGAVLYFKLPVVQLGGYAIDMNPPREKAVFDMLTDFAMFGAVLFETLAVATIFVFRRTIPNAPRPYRCWGYPFVPLAYLVIPAFIFVNMFINQQVEALGGVAFVGAGVVVYFLMKRPGRIVQ